MKLDSLVMEVTRRCNFACDHCLRGPAQNAVMSDVTIEQTIESLKHTNIDCITITGGEPFLVVPKIRKIFETVKKHEIPCGFYIATNGAVPSLNDPATVSLLCEMAEYMQYEHEYDPEFQIPFVQISSDIFHRDCCESDRREKTMVDWLRFVSYRGQDLNTYRRDMLVMQGNNLACGRSLFHPHVYTNDEHQCVETLYIDCFGNALPDCDFSYETMDRLINAGYTTNIRRVDWFKEHIEKWKGVENIVAEYDITIQHKDGRVDILE